MRGIQNAQHNTNTPINQTSKGQNKIKIFRKTNCMRWSGFKWDQIEKNRVLTTESIRSGKRLKKKIRRQIGKL